MQICYTDKGYSFLLSLICLAKSLIEKKGFDLKNQITKYCNWHQNGYMSSNGECFDIGGTVVWALRSFNMNGKADAGSTAFDSAGNGSIMRLAPVPIYYHRDYDAAIDFARESSRSTHGAETCLDACHYLSHIIYNCINFTDRNKDEVLRMENSNELCSQIDEIASGSYKVKQPPEIAGTGYVVQSLEAAIWAFYTTDNFKDAILAAVNLGDDADTTAAICGQIAGSYYGVDAIPEEWYDRLKMVDQIVEIGLELYFANEKK